MLFADRWKNGVDFVIIFAQNFCHDDKFTI